MKTPTRQEVDTMLEAARRSIRTMPREAAVAMCRERVSWMQSNWNPAVAKATAEQLRKAFKDRFKR